MITAAVTGGTGFIGRRLVERLLERGERVRVLTRQPGAEPRGSIRFAGDLGSEVPAAFLDGADVVYHLAAELADQQRMERVNAHGTRRLLTAAMGRCGRWVQLSSVGVYGPPREDRPIDESTEPRPVNAYERSKLAADRAVEEMCASANCPWGIVRPSNVVGADMRNQSAFDLVRAIRRGRFVFFGSERAVSTYVHVDDVVQAVMSTAAAASGTVVNISSDCPWTTLVGHACDRMGCRLPRIRVATGAARPIAVAFGKIPGFPLSVSRVEALAREAGYPTDLAKRAIGFVPLKPMPSGFDEVIDRAIART